MKKAGVFYLGLIIGVLGTLSVLYLMDIVGYQTYDDQPYDDQPYNAQSNDDQSNDDEIPGLTIFDEKGECIPTDREIEVVQVLGTSVALAHTHKYYDNRITVLLVNYDGKSYYDQQKVKVPSGQCARQIGTYKYSTNLGLEKTVPVVVIE